MKSSKHYAKIVKWSDEDECYIGTCPELFYGGCHGDDEQAVFARLCQLVEETIELDEQDGRNSPPTTKDEDRVNREQGVA